MTDRIKDFLARNREDGVTIEQIATDKLGMVYPNGKDVVVVRP